jgi:hypothetical protein
MVHGHPVEVPAQAMGVARLSYADACQRPLGGSDYIALARAYHTILLEEVPVIPPAQRDEAKRFITMIDVLYERRVKLIVSAAAEPDALYRAESGSEAFEFARTVSRLPRCARATTSPCRAGGATRSPAIRPGSSKPDRASPLEAEPGLSQTGGQAARGAAPHLPHKDRTASWLARRSR